VSQKGRRMSDAFKAVAPLLHRWVHWFGSPLLWWGLYNVVKLTVLVHGISGHVVALLHAPHCIMLPGLVTAVQKSVVTA
jgi:hypothetical protein